MVVSEGNLLCVLCGVGATVSSLPKRMLLLVGGSSSLRSLLSWPRLLQSARSRLELLLASTASCRGCGCCWWWWLCCCCWVPRSASFTCGSGSCSCEVLRELPIRNFSLKGAISNGLWDHLLLRRLMVGYFSNSVSLLWEQALDVAALHHNIDVKGTITEEGTERESKRDSKRDSNRFTVRL